MKYIAVFAFLLVFSCKAKSSYRQEMCRSIFVSNTIMNNKNGHLVESELWNEYDPNADSYPIPDTIFIRSSLFATDYIFGGDSIPSFSLSISVQLKFGLSGYCLQVINPFLLPESFIIEDKKFTPKDFFGNRKPDVNNYKTVIINTPFYLKNFINKHEKDIKKNDLALCQIIVKSYIVYSNKEKCIIEYIHPICSTKATTPYSFE